MCRVASRIRFGSAQRVLAAGVLRPVAAVMLPLRLVVVMVVVVMVAAMHCGSRLSYPVGRQRVE